MIDIGVPEGRDEWPEGVLERLRNFSQGDVVHCPPLFYYADPKVPVFRDTGRYTVDSQGPEIIYADLVSPEYGLITTQTCDISEEDSKRPLRPWVQLAPVYALQGNSGYKKSLKKGRGPSIYLHVPKLPEGEFWVADFRLEIPVEKGWLAFQERIDGFGNEQAKRGVGKRVAWLRERPAFSRSFVAAILHPLVEAFHDLHECDPEQFEKMDNEIEEIALRCDSLLEPTTAQLVFLGGNTFSDTTIAWCHEWWDSHQVLAGEVGISLHAFDFQSFQEMNAAEYRTLTILLRAGLLG